MKGVKQESAKLGKNAGDNNEPDRIVYFHEFLPQ